MKQMLVAAALSTSLFALPALAATELRFTASSDPAQGGIGSTATIDFDGFQMNNGTPVSYTGLTSSITFTLLGLSTAGTGSTATTSFLFGYTLDNTTAWDPLTSGSRVSGFGFDVTPVAQSAQIMDFAPDPAPTVVKVGKKSSASASTPNLLENELFSYVHVDPNGQNISNGKDLYVDICLTENKNNCPGGGNGGVKLGETGEGRFALKFLTSSLTSIPTGAPAGFTMDNFVTRYQSITNAQYGYKDDSGVGRPITPVTPAIPEPATWAMMLIGFAGLGLVAQRRNAARGLREAVAAS